nr:FAD-dependent oxidoreductase [Lachnospiraceae bacterium]
MYDVIIIGAGVSGAAIARELSRKERKVLVIERASDVCEGTSKANSGIVHSGYDAKPGTMKAKMNLRGNELMPQLAKDLDFPFKQNGSLVLCFDEADRPALNELLERGQKNGVKDLRIVEREELKQMEPNVSDKAVAALYAPTGGIVCPFNLTIA